MGTPYRNYAAKLSIPGKSNDELTYAFHESSLEHQHAPLTLFGVFSIKSTNEQYQLLIGETVKNFLDYYRRITQSPPPNIKQDGINSQEFIFENAIQYTHEHVTHALLEAQDERGKIQGIEMKKVHFLLGAICEGQLYASITGSGIHALYFYPVYQKHGFSHYSSVDVIHGSKESGEEGGSSRLFSSLINGNISTPRSILAICNNSFLDYISSEQLKQAVTGNPIEAVAPYFQRLLGKINAKSDFCALFLDAHYTPSATARSHQQTVSNESMAVLNSKEEGTEKILFPAFAAQIKKILPLLWKGIFFCIHKVLQSFQLWIPRAYKAGNVFFVHTIRSLKNKKINRVHASQASQNTPSKISEKISIPRIQKGVILHMQSFFHIGIQKIIKLFLNIRHAIVSRFAILPRTSKPLLFISILFLVLFGASIAIIQKKNTEQRQQRMYAEILQNAQEESDLAEASLIYNNTQKARALLTQAQQRLRDFPLNDKKNQERYKKINEHMEIIAERINRITPLKNLTVFSRLDTYILPTDTLKLLSSDDHILLTTLSNAYAVDLASRKITSIQTQTKIPSISCGVGLVKKSFYLCDAQTRRIFLLDSASSSPQLIPLKLAKDETSLDSLTFYNQRLYILSAHQGTLFRHNKNKNGFDAGIPVIKNLTLDSKQLSFSIDGSIYILQNGEQILKYTSGKKELFILPFIDPPQKNIKKIWTDSDASFLYIFEPSQKRILVVDKKTRTLKAQLTSDILAGAKDFAILPKKKLLFVLHGTTLYQTALDTQ